MGIEILCYILAMYGLTNLMVYGSGPWNMLGKFRDFSHKYLGTIGDMLECMMCTSTNFGWIMSLINILLIDYVNPFTPFNIIFYDTSLWYLIIPLDAFITSGSVWLIHTLQETLESITAKNEK